MPPPPPSPKTGNQAEGPVQAMVVGAHDFIAGKVCEILEKDNRIEVVAKPADGAEAVGQFRDTDAEVLILDIGGDPKQALTSISRLLRIDSKAQIIIISTLSFTNVKAGIKGLERGAAEFLQTPAAHTKDSSHAVFRHNLTETVHGLGLARRRAGKRAIKKAPDKAPAKPIRLRRESRLAPKILVIGSSTGGPQVLLRVFKTLSPSVRIPVLVTQHMPPAFTAALAMNIAKNTGWPCAEGKDGEIIEAGRVYLAPGDYHMVIEDVAKGGGKGGSKGGSGVARIRINQDPQVNYCRPAVDPMFRSAAEIYGAKTLAVILTGMGNDGEAGAAAIAEAGGTIVAQDEETSVVWGMPGAVAVAGLCSAVLPVAGMAGYLNKFITGKSA